jgi:hypothetical protein
MCIANAKINNETANIFFHSFLNTCFKKYLRTDLTFIQFSFIIFSFTQHDYFFAGKISTGILPVSFIII